MTDVDIDFVILWVDGNDPEHRKKRAYWQEKEKGFYDYDPEQSVGESRFIQHDELKYCLRSIKNHAPWYRKIWLVTDDQIPSFLDPALVGLDRIEIVDHKVLFKGYEQYLPTFNTRAIATMMHRIPGLSEHFIYGNDDFFIGSRVSTSFFFKGNYPVVYGDWVSEKGNESLRLHQVGVINGAKLEGYNQSKFFNVSHGFCPMIKSQILKLQDKHKKNFLNNIKYKFRHTSQFVFESLFNHSCVGSPKYWSEDTKRMIHFSNELCQVGAANKIDFLFGLFKTGERSMFCLNDADALMKRLPHVSKHLNNICGGPLFSECIEERAV